jgi:hypothetical protein
MAGLSFQCQCSVWQAVEKEDHFICIIDVLSLVALQQLQNSLDFPDKYKKTLGYKSSFKT